MIIDHIGIAVSDLESEITRYCDHFGFSLTLRERVESQNTEIVFLNDEHSSIELLSPINDSGPVSGFLEKKGPGLHHLAYRVENITEELSRLKNLGYRLVDEEPRPGANNSQIAFLHPASNHGTLIELCEIKA